MLAGIPITVTPIVVQLTAPDTAIAGATIALGWNGPDYVDDDITVSELGDDRDIDYANTQRGNPAELTTPDTPGIYELRYVMRQDSTVIGTCMIIVTK